MSYEVFVRVFWFTNNYILYHWALLRRGTCCVFVEDYLLVILILPHDRTVACLYFWEWSSTRLRL
jgi:hypothetical protein